MPKNQKKKYKYFFLIALVFVSSFFLLAPDIAEAATRFDCAPGKDGFKECWNSGGEIANTGGLAEVVANIVGAPFELAFKGLLYGLLQVLGLLLSAAVTIFGYVVKPEHFQQLFQLPAIYEMWKFVRDFFNLFFILTLLYIAFTIIFQIAGDYKKTLLSLVLAALFINFSFPLSRFLIDAANVPMYFFINQAVPAKDINSPEKVLGTVLSASQIKNILIPQSIKNFTGTTIAQYLMSIVVMFLLSVSLMVIAVMLLIRILALFILVIFSAIGFAGAVIPGMQKYSSMWWENFTKYALFGPASMLMLLITVRILDGLQTSTLFSAVNGIAIKNTISSDVTTVAALAVYLIPIILLWFTIGLAQTMSLAGAGAVVGTGQRFAKWSGKLPFRGAWAGAKYGGRKYEKWVVGKGNAGKYFSPTALVSSWKAWREESQHQDHAPVERAAAGVQDRLNRVFGEHTNHAFAVAEAQKAKAAKEITDVSTNSDYVINELTAALHGGEREKVEGALLALAKDNNLNDLLIAQGEHYGAEMIDLKDAQGNPLLDAEGNTKQAVKINPANFKKVIKGILLEAGVKEGSEEMAMKLMVLSDTATASGNFGAGGMATYSGGKWQESTEQGQAQWAASKVKNLESQKRQTTLHPDSMYEYYFDGEGKKHYTDLSTTGLEIAMTFTGGDVTESRRSRDDNKQGMHALEQMRQAGNIPPRFKEAIAKNPKVAEYATTVSGYFAAPAPNAQPGGTGAATGPMSSGAHGSPVALPTPSAGGGPRRNP